MERTGKVTPIIQCKELCKNFTTKNTSLDVLENLNIDALSKLLGLLPDQLLQIYQALRYFNVYDLGICVVNAMQLLLPLWLLASAILVPLMYRQFRRRLTK